MFTLFVEDDFVFRTSRFRAKEKRLRLHVGQLLTDNIVNIPKIFVCLYHLYGTNITVYAEQSPVYAA